MAHYALLNENNIVTNVIYVDNMFIIDENGNDDETLAISMCREGLDNKNARLIKTSISNKIRNKYAAIGDTYSEEYDVFISPKPYPSSILNTTTFFWDTPVPKPTDAPDGFYYEWDEDVENWVLLEYPKLPLIPRQISQDYFRSKLTLSEKLLWDNPDTSQIITQKAAIVTVKNEFPLTIDEEKTTELLDLLISENVFTEQRLNEILSEE